MLPAFLSARRNTPISKSMQLLLAGSRDYREAITHLVPVSPIDSKLPDELLAHIFTCGLEAEVLETENDPLERTVNRGRPTFPDLVASVSRRWRALAFSTPALWMVLTHNRTLGCISGTGRHQRQDIRRWLARAGAVDLRIRLLWGLGQSWLQSSSLDEALRKELLEMFLKRGRELRITVKDASSLLNLFKTLSAAQNVRTRRLDLICTLPFHPRPLDLGEHLRSWTKLRNLRLFNVSFPAGLKALSGLTSLVLECVTVDYLYSNEFYDALRACTDLIELSLTSKGPAIIFQDVPIETFSIPRLTTLSLDSVPEECANKLLTTIQTPSLIHLSIARILCITPWTNVPHTRTLWRVIQGLSLDCSRLALLELDEHDTKPEHAMDSEAIVGLLGSMPRLKVLRLGFMHDLAQWFTVLLCNAIAAGEAPLVPELSKLVIYGAIWDYQLSQLLQSLAARSGRSDIQPLQNLEAWVHAPFG